MLSGTTPAEWNSVIVTPVYKKGRYERSRQLRRVKLSEFMLQNLHKNTK